MHQHEVMYSRTLQTDLLCVDTITGSDVRPCTDMWPEGLEGHKILFSPESSNLAEDC